MKQIPFAPSYAMTETGDVIRIVDCDNAKAGKVLRQWVGSGGYKRVRLTTDGVTRLWHVHRLLCVVYHGPPPSADAQACHCNGDRTDNRVGNLRWDSAKGNSDDRWSHGTMRTGESHVLCRLSEADVAAIRAVPAYYGVNRDLGARYGIHRSNICAIRKGRRRVHG